LYEKKVIVSRDVTAGAERRVRGKRGLLRQVKSFCLKGRLVQVGNEQELGKAQNVKKLINSPALTKRNHRKREENYIWGAPWCPLWGRVVLSAYLT